jgi:hypothetical protein
MNAKVLNYICQFISKTESYSWEHYNNNFWFNPQKIQFNNMLSCIWIRKGRQTLSGYCFASSTSLRRPTFPWARPRKFAKYFLFLNGIGWTARVSGFTIESSTFPGIIMSFHVLNALIPRLSVRSPYKQATSRYVRRCTYKQNTSGYARRWQSNLQVELYERQYCSTEELSQLPTESTQTWNA